MNEPSSFAVLSLPARPWIEGETLHQRFLELAALWHPDANPTPEAGERFQRINTAHKELQDPVQRIACLLYLHDRDRSSPPPNTSLPGDLPELFLLLSNVKQRVALFLEKLASARSPLSRALLMQEGMELRTALKEVLANLHARWEEQEEAIREADVLWETKREVSVGLLRSIHGIIVYLQKWRQQLNEAIARIEGAALG